jgi:hypothetical protein
VTAINVLIEPDEKTRALARDLNARLRRTMPEGFAFDATHAPHITVLQRYVHSAALGQVLDAVGATVAGAEGASMRLRATRIAQAQWDAPGIGIASLMLGRDPELLELQATVMAAVAPFTAAHGTAAAFVREPGEDDINATTMRYVERFVPDHCGSSYEAHLSFGVGRLGDLEELESEPFEPLDVVAETVAVYQLGNNGTARRLLQGWPLLGGE